MTDAHIEIKGKVVETVKDGFLIQVEGSEQTIFAKLGGKLRQHKVRILLSDIVTVKVSPYDLTHVIISRRH